MPRGGVQDGNSHTEEKTENHKDERHQQTLWKTFPIPQTPSFRESRPFSILDPSDNCDSSRLLRLFLKNKKTSFLALFKSETNFVGMCPIFEVTHYSLKTMFFFVCFFYYLTRETNFAEMCQVLEVTVCTEICSIQGFLNIYGFEAKNPDLVAAYLPWN